MPHKKTPPGVIPGGVRTVPSSKAKGRRFASPRYVAASVKNTMLELCRNTRRFAV
jgi:hypothetical protein